MRTPFPPTRICEETRLLAHTLHSNCEDQEINTATILLVPDLRQLQVFSCLTAFLLWQNKIQDTENLQSKINKETNRVPHGVFWLKMTWLHFIVTCIQLTLVWNSFALKFFKKLLYLSIGVGGGRRQAHAYRGTCVEIRGQPAEVSSCHLMSLYCILLGQVPLKLLADSSVCLSSPPLQECWYYRFMSCIRTFYMGPGRSGLGHYPLSHLPTEPSMEAPFIVLRVLVSSQQ